MQTAAPHNVESDVIQLSDEYRAVDVPLSFVHYSSLAVDPPYNQTDVYQLILYYQLTKIPFK